jgi:hypothetical protein
MKRKLFVSILIVFVSFFQYNCAPSLRSAKIQPGFSVDGVILGTMFTSEATDEDGNDVSSNTDFSSTIPLDVKFRYGWEREENFGFELSGGLDGQMGAYLELPGTEAFHWGIGAETNLWILAASSNLDDNEDELGKFISEHNYQAFLMAGLILSPEVEISAGIKYQPWLKTILEDVPKEEIDVTGTLPVSYLIDGRYMFAEHWGIMAGAELYHLSFEGNNKEEASMTGGYIYLGITFR